MSEKIELPAVLRDLNFRFIKLGSKGKWLKIPIEPGWNIFDVKELKIHIEKKAAQRGADKSSGKHAEMKVKDQYVKKTPRFAAG